MPDEVVSIRGLVETQRSLADLPEEIVLGLFPDAMAAGASVIEAELARRTPRADRVTTTAKKYGRLVDDLGTLIDIDVPRLRGRAQIGFGTDGFFARMVEYGHAQVYENRTTGFTPAHPFLRPAADAATDAAAEAFAESLGENIR